MVSTQSNSSKYFLEGNLPQYSSLATDLFLAGKLRLQLKQYGEAIQVYKELLDINPENTTYYNRLAEAERHTTPNDTLHMLQKYEELFPRAIAPRRMQLNYATGDEFKVLVDRYLRRGNLSTCILIHHSDVLLSF